MPSSKKRETISEKDYSRLPIVKEAYLEDGKGIYEPSMYTDLPLIRFSLDGSRTMFQPKQL